MFDHPRIGKGTENGKSQFPFGFFSSYMFAQLAQGGETMLLESPVDFPEAKKKGWRNVGGPHGSQEGGPLGYRHHR